MKNFAKQAFVRTVFGGRLLRPYLLRAHTEGEGGFIFGKIIFLFFIVGQHRMRSSLKRSLPFCLAFVILPA